MDVNETVAPEQETKAALCSRKHRAIELLLLGNNVLQVAAVIGVGRTTVWRWTQDPKFSAALDSAQHARRAAINEAISSAALDAVAYMKSVLHDDSAHPAIRVRAAVEIVKHAMAIGVPARRA